MRLRWRGVAVEGVAPPHLDKATESHIAVALKQLGTELSSSPPIDAEGGADCRFAPGGKSASCVVEVVHSSDGLRAERKADVPFHDAEDLAESLALLVADMLQNDLKDIAVPAPRPEPPPPKPKTNENESGDVNANVNGNANVNANANVNVRKRRALGPSGLVLEIGPSVVVGFTGDPPVYGVLLRGLYAQGLLRVGGALSLTGTELHRGGYDLSFVRLATGPRVGLGIARRRVDFDVVAGPALLLIATDAHITDGTHTHADLAFALGVRLLVVIAAPLALIVGADAAVALSREQVVAGPQQLAEFGLGSLELTLGLAYHR